MSYQVLLDFPGASARSKGQARRRNQPVASEDARKDQRNFARRERARRKRLSLVQPSSNANQLQHDGQMTMKDKTAYQPALPPHPPAITILPAHPIDINCRALAQSKRYIAAQSKVQETTDSVRIDEQRLKDVTRDGCAVPARDSLESQSTPTGQDFDAAGILLAVAQEPRNISTTPELGDMLSATVDEPEENTISTSSWTCLVSTCIDHHKRFLSKPERDKHTRTHFAGMYCDHSDCRSWNDSIDRLFAHIKFFHGQSSDAGKHFTCQNCTQELSQSDYLMAQNHTEISQEQGRVYSHSGQYYKSRTYHIQQPQEHSQVKIAEETLSSTNSYQESKSKPQSLPTPAPDGPACHETKYEPVGLGITLTDDAKWGQSHGEKYSSSDWEREFRDELMKWSTVWDPDDAE